MLDVVTGDISLPRELVAAVLDFCERRGLDADAFAQEVIVSALLKAVAVLPAHLYARLQQIAQAPAPVRRGPRDPDIGELLDLGLIVRVRDHFETTAKGRAALM